MKHLLTILAAFTFSLSLFSQTICSLQSFSYEIIQSEEGFYFVVNEPSSDVLVQNYNIIVNNEVYDSASVKTGPFEADCETNYTFQLAHRTLDFCQVTASIGTVCFNSDDCIIGDIQVSYPECDSGTVMIDLDFTYQNTSDSFFLRGNGNFYGEYAYADLPISVGPVESNCNKEYEFAVIDAVDQFCKNATGSIIVCCPDNCGRPEFEIISQECEAERLYITLLIKEGEFISNSTVQINGEAVSDFIVDGPFLYLESFLPLDDSLNTLTVCTVGFADLCCASQTFFPNNCQTDSLCNIFGLEHWIEECQPGEDIYVSINFGYTEMTSDSFKVNGSGVYYGEFAYADLPIKVGPFESLCDQVYELEISDSVNPECTEVLEDLVICCGNGCLDPIFEIVDLNCGDNEMRIKLELINPLFSDYLFVSINDDSLVNYEVEHPYVYIEYPIDSVGEFVLELCTNTIANTTCCYSQAFDLSSCNSISCKIESLTAKPSDCIDTDLPSFHIDFEYQSVGSEGFSLNGNGINYGNYRYEDLPIFVLVEDNCDLSYEFVVTDNEFGCSAAIDAGPYCCNSECSFRASNLRTKCEDGILSEVAFYLGEDTDPIKAYEVFIDGKFIGETASNNVFLEFETSIPLDGTNSVILTICDSDCCVEYSLDVSECVDPPSQCSIGNIALDQVTCGEEGLQFTLEFQHEGTNSEYFDVFSIFGYFGTYKYDDLPLKIQNFPNVNLGLNVLFICDKGSFCCQAHLFSSPFCQGFNDDGVSSVQSLSNDVEHNYLVGNPADYEIELRSPVQKNVYRIFNSSGKIVLTEKSLDFRSKVDVSDLKAGLYVIRIENEMGMKIEKLIIAK